MNIIEPRRAGVGARFIQEVTRQAGRGWPTMIVLGVSYTLAEEGLASHR